MRPWCVLRAVALWLCLASASSASDPLRVFAAASLGGVLEAVDATECCGKLKITYAGSGALARQIAAGAPVDVVMLADDL